MTLTTPTYSRKTTFQVLQANEQISIDIVLDDGQTSGLPRSSGPCKTSKRNWPARRDFCTGSRTMRAGSLRKGSPTATRPQERLRIHGPSGPE